MNEQAFSPPSSLDASIALQDPYSDVSLFLSRKIKEQIKLPGSPKEWSLYLQEMLVEKVSAEFQRKFPYYRLSVSALKKTWKKISHISQLFENQNDALTIEGKVNLHFLVRENLKNIFSQRKNASFHPFLLAQQLALKVGESMATFEGVRPALQSLTQLIWSAEHHLLPFNAASLSSSPIVPRDPKDRLIVKWMLDCLMQSPEISQQQLYLDLQEKIKQFQSLKELKEPIPWVSLLSMEWASILLPHCSFIQTYPSPLIQKLRAWIQCFPLENSSKTLDEHVQDIKTAYLLEKPLQSDLFSASLYELEILSWCCLKERLPKADPLIIPLLDQISREAKSQLIDMPLEHWKTAIHRATLFFIKAHEICLTWNTANWNHRLLFWSMQGELVLRSLQFPETPLLHFIREQKNRPLNDPDVVAQFREQFLSQYQSPLIEPSLVHQKGDLLRKYVWYHHLSSPQETTLDRWLLLQNISHLDLEASIEHLISRAEQTLPLLPLDRKWILRNHTFMNLFALKPLV